jgi:hypothetical protein
MGGRELTWHWSDLPNGVGGCIILDMIVEKNPRDCTNTHTECIAVFGFHSNVVEYLFLWHMAAHNLIIGSTHLRKI